MIEGGYYIKARKIRNGEIAHAPPHVREIWDWLIQEANHKNNGKIKRGQTIRSYRDIQESLKWYVGFRKEVYSKWQCDIAMKWLTKHEMITTTKTTRGLLITICNYEYYQDPKNYENHTEDHTRTTRKPQPPDTINKNDKNEEEGKSSMRVAERKKKITPKMFDEFWKLYPGKKADKGKCVTKWATICGRKEDVPTWGDIRVAINRQKKSKRWKEGYIPYPHTWLNQKRWLDDPEVMDDRRDEEIERRKTSGGAEADENYYDKFKDKEV